jgi:hypothetical protein
LNKSKTHGGGNAKYFEWYFKNEMLYIKNENEIEHKYNINQIIAAIIWIFCKFELKEFPLANNVQKIGNGTEIDGLGVALYNVKNNTTFAQGSSYLGVVLEEIGIFERVNDTTIKWKILENQINQFDILIKKLTSQEQQC